MCTDSLVSFVCDDTPILFISIPLSLSPFSSSVKATEKREGGGAHNWGKAEDVELKYVCM